jgi:uncharacterized membrane protein YfcA
VLGLEHQNHDNALYMDILYPVAGALTGFIVGLTGIGGGALMTPMLLLMFGVAPTAAVATDLWFATLTKLAAVYIHHREQQVDWKIVRRLWAGSLPGTALVILCLCSGLLAHLSAKFLTSAIGAVILLTAVGLLLKQRLTNRLKTSGHHQPLNNTFTQNISRLQKPLTVVSGLILGILVAFTSVGAGALGSIALLYLYPGLTPNKLVGTDIAHAIPLALLAGLGYLIGGHVDLNILMSLLIGSIPAALLGSIVATKFSDRKLRLCLVAILGISGVRLLF